MNQFKGYRVGDRVKTSMGIAIIVSLWMGGCKKESPCATLNYGPQNPSCPAWLDEIHYKLNP